MSEARDTSMDLDALTRTRQPFDLDDEMKVKVKELKPEDTVRQLKEEGYGYIHNAADDEFNARLRETILRLSAKTPRRFPVPSPWAAPFRARRVSLSPDTRSGLGGQREYTHNP